MNKFLNRRLLIIFGVIAAGVLALNILGKFFISEIIQDVEVRAIDEVVLAEEGFPAPSFELPSLDDQSVKLSDFSGDVLVLTFWTTWNLQSADQIKIFDDYLSRDQGGFLKILAVSSQEQKSVVESFMRRSGYEVAVALDETGAVTQNYAAHILPATYFIDEEGVIREVFVGIFSEKALVEKAERLIR